MLFGHLHYIKHPRYRGIGQEPLLSWINKGIAKHCQHCKLLVWLFYCLHRLNNGCFCTVWPIRYVQIHRGIVNYKNQFIQFVAVTLLHCRAIFLPRFESGQHAFLLLHFRIYSLQAMNLFVKYPIIFRAIFVQEVIKFFNATCSSMYTYIIHFSIGFIKKTHGNVKMLICEYFQTCARLNR